MPLCLCDGFKFIIPSKFQVSDTFETVEAFSNSVRLSLEQSQFDFFTDTLFNMDLTDSSASKTHVTCIFWMSKTNSQQIDIKKVTLQSTMPLCRWVYEYFGNPSHWNSWLLSGVKLQFWLHTLCKLDNFHVLRKILSRKSQLICRIWIQWTSAFWMHATNYIHPQLNMRDGDKGANHIFPNLRTVMRLISLMLQFFWKSKSSWTATRNQVRRLRCRFSNMIGQANQSWTSSSGKNKKGFNKRF